MKRDRSHRKRRDRSAGRRRYIVIVVPPIGHSDGWHRTSPTTLSRTTFFGEFTVAEGVALK